MVSFMPESAHNASWQTTSSSSSSGLQLAVLLPLPAGCARLEEGGWLHVYAVKMPPACLMEPHKLVQHMQLTEEQQQQPGQVTSQPLPAVTLLAQRYVNALQLTRLLDANPAAAAVSQMLCSSKAQLSSPAAAAAAAAASKVGTSKDSSSSSYSCVLHLQAAAAAAGDVQQQAFHQGAAPPAKRPKQVGQLAPPNHEQQQQHLQPLGSALGSWLASVGCLQQQQDAGRTSSFGLGSTAASGLLLPFGTSSGQQAALALPGMPPLALLNGHVDIRLGQGCQGQLAWAARPQLQQQQQGQQQNVLPVQLALQATSVPALAQLHRAVMLAVLEQIEDARLSSWSSCASSVGSSSSSRRMWQLLLQQPQQLRTVLQRLKQLQQQLLLLQDVADDTLEARAGLITAVQAARVSGGFAGSAATRTAAATTAAGVAGAAERLAELQQQQVKWERGLHVVYGRMLLALAGAACLVCQEA
jgi:hypothetical protein